MHNVDMQRFSVLKKRVFFSGRKFLLSTLYNPASCQKPIVEILFPIIWDKILLLIYFVGFGKTQIYQQPKTCTI